MGCRVNIARTVVVSLLLALPAAASETVTPHWVRVAADKAELVTGLGLQVRNQIDYGSYLWLELSAGDLGRIMAAGATPVEVPGAGTIHLPAYQFDPLLDGEPGLSSKLTSTEDPTGLRLVQVVGPPKDAWLADLRSRGIDVIQYLPHHTYLVWAEDAGKLTRDLPASVRWQGAYHPAYKLSPELDSGSGPTPTLAVSIYNDGQVELTVEAVESAGGRVLTMFPSRPDRLILQLVVEAEAAAAPALAQSRAVIWIEPQSRHLVLGDEMASAIVAGSYEDGVPRPGYREWLQDQGYDGTGVTWSVVDSGVDPDHPDLSLSGGHTHGECTTIPGDENDLDPDGHGTSVAGLLAGTGASGHADSDGFIYGLGVAPGTAIFSQTLCLTTDFPPRSGWQELSRIAVLAGASGSNNSWRTPDPGYRTISQIYDYMVRDGNFDTREVAEEHIIVFLAGNEGPGPGSVLAVAETKNTIVVGATKNHRASLWHEGQLGDIDQVADYSSRGPTRDGRIVPTVVAPGEAVISTINDRGGVLGGHDIGEPEGLYGLFAGTSAAAPHAAGAAAVICEWWRDRFATEVSPAMVKALLVNSAVDIEGTPPVPNFSEGWGRIHLGNALSPGVPRLLADQTHCFKESGQVWKLKVTPADLQQPLKVTLAWSDAPAAVGVSPSLVNDLDLRLEAAGETYLGNRFVEGWSASGGSPDALNNLENAYLGEPVNGIVIVSVEATRLAGDGVPYNDDLTDQDFALICTNCVQVSSETRKPIRRVDD
jgi:subtilisin family serine protease